MGNCDTCKSHGISCTGGEWAREACEKNGMYEPVTNADRIRSMTDRELASFITFQVERKENTHEGERFNRWFDWLKRECE